MSIIVNRVISKLLKNNITIATAESCTGGLVAKTITDYSGVSKIFSEGYITYANDIKEKNLGVKHETLEAYGAVSHQVAKEMAEGVRNNAGTYLGVATTGIAGPTGATKEKPVGLVYVAVSTPTETICRKLRLNGSREKIRYKTVEQLFHLIDTILK